MKKFFAYIFFLILIIVLPIFFVTYDAGKVLKNSSTLKDVFDQSGFYESTTGYFQEMVSHDDRVDRSNKTLLNQINKSVNPDTIKFATETTIDQFFGSAFDARNFTLKYQLPTISVGGTILNLDPLEKDLSGNIGLMLWANLNIIILTLGIVCTLLILFIMLLSPNWSARLIWVSSVAISTATIIAIVYAGASIFAKLAPNMFLQGRQYLGDPQIITAVAKLSDSAWQYQQQFYYLEIVALLVLFVIFLVSGLISRKKTDDLPMDKLDSTTTDLANLPEKGLPNKIHAKD
ncbi:MAG: hypothetical protein WCG48_02535 [Candidatus Berkelbacteria bacterium]